MTILFTVARYRFIEDAISAAQEVAARYVETIYVIRCHGGEYRVSRLAQGGMVWTETPEGGYAPEED